MSASALSLSYWMRRGFNEEQHSLPKPHAKKPRRRRGLRFLNIFRVAVAQSPTWLAKNSREPKLFRGLNAECYVRNHLQIKTGSSRFPGSRNQGFANCQLPFAN